MSSTLTRTIACSATLAVVALAGPIAAQAKSPDAPDAAALRAAGVKVTWPLAAPAPVLTPGQKLTVRVRKVAHAKRAVPVRLALLRTTAKGRTSAVVKAAIVRRGTFSVRVPKAAGKRYALTLKAGKVRYTGRFTTALPAPPDVPPAGPLPVAPAPAPEPTPPANPCWPPAPDPAAATASGVLHLGATSVVAGQSVPYSIENTGTVCLTIGLGYRWERLDGDTWTPVDQQQGSVPAIAFVVPPSTTWTGQSWNWGPIDAQTDASFVPGRYRLVTSANWNNETRSNDVTMTAEIDVTAPEAPPAG